MMKTGRRRKKRKVPLGTRKGHGPKKRVSDPVEVGLNSAMIALQRQGRAEQDLKAFRMGKCTIFVGNSGAGWHLSIAHPLRYPTWDEVAHARYKLLPGNITMAMLLPPQAEYLNLHENTFQMWECVDGAGLLRTQLIVTQEEIDQLKMPGGKDVKAS